MLRSFEINGNCDWHFGKKPLDQWTELLQWYEFEHMLGVDSDVQEVGLGVWDIRQCDWCSIFLWKVFIGGLEEWWQRWRRGWNIIQDWKPTV